MGTRQKIDRDNSFVHVDDFIWAGSKEFCSKDTGTLKISVQDAKRKYCII